MIDVSRYITMALILGGNSSILLEIHVNFFHSIGNSQTLVKFFIWVGYLYIKNHLYMSTSAKALVLVVQVEETYGIKISFLGIGS